MKIIKKSEVSEPKRFRFDYGRLRITSDQTLGPLFDTRNVLQ